MTEGGVSLFWWGVLVYAIVLSVLFVACLFHGILGACASACRLLYGSACFVFGCCARTAHILRYRGRSEAEPATVLREELLAVEEDAHIAMSGANVGEVSPQQVSLRTPDARSK